MDGMVFEEEEDNVEVDGVELKREPRGWPDGRPEVARSWFNDNVPGHTSVLVVDVDGGLWTGSAKRHEEDEESKRVGHLLALQRATPEAGLKDCLRALPRDRLNEILRSL